MDSPWPQENSFVDKGKGSQIYGNERDLTFGGEDAVQYTDVHLKPM